MSSFRNLLINLHQKYNRRLNSGYLEHVYQASYLDMARRTDWLKNIPLSSPNGGTASFSLLYILLSILRGEEINRIMELGVGKSTVLLTQYAEYFKKELSLIDDDEYWLQQVSKKSSYVLPVHAKLSPIIVENKRISWYKCLPPLSNVNLLIIDGPMAYANRIKYNRIGALNWIPEILGDEFIILVDDSNRAGERLLVKQILKKLDQNDLAVKRREIIGGNSQTIIATKKYQKYLYL